MLCNAYMVYAYVYMMPTWSMPMCGCNDPKQALHSNVDDAYQMCTWSFGVIDKSVGT